MAQMLNQGSGYGYTCGSWNSKTY